MSRRDIHYWKCDRPAAFHGTHERRISDPKVAEQLRETLLRHFGATNVTLAPTAAQGNHLTWTARIDGRAMFLRVENGPEADDHLDVESAVMRKVRSLGVPVPEVFAVDTSRERSFFAWQALEIIPHPDLNHWHKCGQLDAYGIPFEIGAAVARWQRIKPEGFGPFDAEICKANGDLQGYHPSYADYFRLRLEQHLDFLTSRSFFDAAQRIEIERAIREHESLLHFPAGCLVHKDLALWNVLGSEHHIAAFIDFDDAISGDPMDDLSLLACFHDSAFLTRAFAGYQSVTPLPEEHIRRFWLHLLRNMVVKAVIRVGAGYFDRTDGFFLIGSGSDGASLRRFTHERIALALRGLASRADISIL